jgi:hypothetical protein
MIRSAGDENVAHELTGILRWKHRVAAVQGIPMIAIGAQSVIDAGFCRLYEIGEEKVLFGLQGRSREQHNQANDSFPVSHCGIAPV